MKKNNSRFLGLLAVAISLSAIVACEKIIDISIPDKERKIVVNGLINSESNVRVNLSRSISVLEYDSIIPISGGDVNLYLGTEHIGKLQEEQGGFYFLPGFLPQTGETYRLTASGGGLQPVEAEAVLPPTVPFISVDTSTLVNQWGGQEFRLSVKFQDPQGVKNIYGIGVEITVNEFDYATMSYTGRKVTHNSYLFSDSEGPVDDEFHNFNGKLYFDDLLFEGLVKTVQFGVSDYSFYESDTVWVNVRLEQVDPSYFLYAVSNEEYQQAHGNPFSEPVQVYTNIKGGYGIFAGSSSEVYPLVMTGLRK